MTGTDVARILLWSLDVVGPEPSVEVISPASLCPMSRRRRIPRCRVIFSVAKMICLVGPNGVSGRPRRTKNSRRESGKITGGSQFAHLLVISSKRCLNVSMRSPSLSFKLNRLPIRANSERVVFCLLS